MILSVPTKKIELKSPQLRFVEQHKLMGFESESALVDFAVAFLQKQIDKADSKSRQLITDSFSDWYQQDLALQIS